MAINLSQITHLPQPLQNKLSELDSDNDGQVTYDDVLQIFGDRVTPDYFSALEEAVSNNDRESILHSWRLITSANQTIRHGIFKKYPLLDQKETKANTERSPTTKQQRSREKQIDLLRHIEGLSNISIQDNTVSADYLDTPCSAFCSESTDLINQLYFESDKKRGILNIEFDDQGYLHSVYDYNNYALDVYDENERPVFRRTSSLHEYYDSKGKLYHPDEHFAAITPTALNETGTDPLEAIKSQITDPSEMLAYDQTYLSVFSKAPPFPPETILAIRQYAKELLGIAEQEERLCTAFNELGISFETELENMVIEGNLSLCRPTLRFLIDSFNMLENQALPFLKTLPPDIIETSDFQSLNIGSHISSGSSTFPGLAIEGRIIFLSAANNFRTFVHEFCHVMDMNHQRPEYRSRDEHDWGMSIYGEDYKYMRNYKVGFGYRPEGFTSQYAFDGKSMYEDRAETATDLLVDYNSLMQRASTDSLLAKKVLYIKRYLYRLTHGRMDQRFWQDRTRGINTSPAYWKQRDEAHNYVSDPVGDDMIRTKELEFEAQEALQNGNIKKAIKTYKQLIQQNPERDYYIKNLISVYQRDQNYEAAIQLLEQAVSDNRITYPYVGLELGGLYSLTGQGDQKLTKLQKLLDEGTVNNGLMRSLSQLYFENDEPEKAKAVYSAALEREENPYVALYYLDHANIWTSKYTSEEKQQITNSVCDIFLQRPPDYLLACAIENLIYLKQLEAAHNLLTNIHEKYPEDGYVNSMLDSWKHITRN